jgi:hypothetical protein
MIIDLNKDSNLNYAETSFELAQLKSNKLVKEIVMQRNKTGQNFMIVPMSIYNILEVNKSFQFAPIGQLINEDTSDFQPLRLMGYINDIEVYLDLLSPSDTIILRHDKSIIRDNKIDAILNGDKLKEEIEITILNY